MVIRRVKDRWHNSTPGDTRRLVLNEKTLHDQASALAYISWGLALNGAINLHAEDFRYDSDQQRVAVICELLAFELQYLDRLSHEFLEDTERASLIEELCRKIADHVQDNLSDIAGPGNYRPPFVALLNERFSEYAEFDYADERPGYAMRRFLGMKILEIMGEDQTNRWVIDQIIDIDSPELVDQNLKSMKRLFGRDQKKKV